MGRFDGIRNELQKMQRELNTQREVNGIIESMKKAVLERKEFIDVPSGLITFYGIEEDLIEDNFRLENIYENTTRISWGEEI